MTTMPASAFPPHEYSFLQLDCTVEFSVKTVVWIFWSHIVKLLHGGQSRNMLADISLLT